MLQDGCDSHFCKVSERGEYIWEKRIMSCPPFDEHKCLAEGVSSWSSGPAFHLTVSIFDCKNRVLNSMQASSDMIS